MNARRIWLLASAVPALGICLAGCSKISAFNENCPTSRAVVGQTSVALDISKKTLRSREAAAGDLVADAVLAANASASPVAALQNAGGVRPEVCGGGNRDTIPAGPISETDLDDLLPFENYVTTVVVSGPQLKSTLERSVSSLPDDTDGWFLQVAGMSFAADCTKQRQILSADGTSIITEGIRVDPASIVVGGVAWSTSASYTIATNDFVANGQDGFLAMKSAQQSATAILYTDAVRDYLGSHSPVAPTGTGRITLTGCTPP